MEYAKQINSKIYSTQNYFNLNRWSSYSLLVSEIIKIQPHNVLEIGPGNFILSNILKNMNIVVETLDFAEELKPDYIADISDYKSFPNKRFDCIIAAQVFEHIRYKDFITILKQLKNNTDTLILTLPYTTKYSLFFSIDFYIPLIKYGKLTFKIIYKKIKHQFNGQHYWEIGKKGFGINKIKSDIRESNWKIIKSYINPKNPYHYLFILK